MSPLFEGDLTRSVISAFYEAYNILGHGQLESVYVHAMVRELAARGHRVEREVVTQVQYKGEPLCLTRIDLVVDDKLVVEIKATAVLHPTALQQTYTYIRTTSYEVALLLHFGPKPLFKRFVSRNTKGKNLN